MKILNAYYAFIFTITTKFCSITFNSDKVMPWCLGQLSLPSIRGRMALKWPSMCWCAVKKLLTHSLTGPASDGKRKADIVVHSICGYTRGCAGKTVKSLDNACHAGVPLQWCSFTKGCYIKCVTFTVFYFHSIQQLQSWLTSVCASVKCCCSSSCTFILSACSRSASNHNKHCQIILSWTLYD